MDMMPILNKGYSLLIKWSVTSVQKQFEIDVLD